MFFDKKKYIDIIGTKKVISIMSFITTIIISLAIAYKIGKNFEKEFTLWIIIGLTIGSIIAELNYIRRQKEIEEMKMKLDIYMQIMNNKK